MLNEKEFEKVFDLVRSFLFHIEEFSGDDDLVEDLLSKLVEKGMFFHSKEDLIDHVDTIIKRDFIYCFINMGIPADSNIEELEPFDILCYASHEDDGCLEYADYKNYSSKRKMFSESLQRVFSSLVDVGAEFNETPIYYYYLTQMSPSFASINTVSEDYIKCIISLCQYIKSKYPRSITAKGEAWLDKLENNPVSLLGPFIQSIEQGCASQSEPELAQSGNVHIKKVLQYPVDFYGDVRTLVRGLPYQCPDDWEEVLDSLNEDSNLYLIKEPDNPKDNFAIAAYLDDRRIGYVAASDNTKVWLFMTDEKIPCTFLERFEASFKISFDNPRSEFDGIPFEEIYKDKFGVTEQPFASFEIPFLTNPKDEDYDWYDDSVFISDLERVIPDFRRKLAARMIVFAGRKNSKGEYCYYLPYANNPIADVEDETIKGLIEEHGFVIALPDVPMMSKRGGIFMDLHVTYLTGIIFWTFNDMHHSEFVFRLSQNIAKKEKTVEEPSHKVTHGDEYYEVSDSPEGGKHVSMGVIIPEEGDEEFDFCTHECYILDEEHIELITAYMERYKQGKEPRPFLMIGRQAVGLDGVYAFHSLDGEIIFKFIFDDKITSWIKEAGFVLGKVLSYKKSITGSLDVTLSISKRKAGEKLFEKASEEAMDYIDEYTDSCADPQLEEKIIEAVKGTDTPYKVLVIPKDGIGICTTLDGEVIATITDDEIIKLAEQNKGAFGYITDIDYDDDGEFKYNVWFTIRVSRSIPRLTLEQDSESADSTETMSSSSATDENDAKPRSMSEEEFAQFISENFGCDVLNAPNPTWKYDTTDFMGNGREMFETYIFKKRITGNPKCKEIVANVIKGSSVNFSMYSRASKRDLLALVYKYKKMVIPDYTMEECKKEYGQGKSSICVDDVNPYLTVSLPYMGYPGSLIFYTSFCNKDYVVKQKANGTILTLKR